MNIPVWSYLKEYELEREEILDAIDGVFQSGRLILGTNVSSFENEFSSYCGATYGIGVGSGTDALFLALKALGLGPGDEVITVANTAVPTISAIVSTGATPRFVDIELPTYLIDPAKIEAAINCNTRCILPVHLYGHCADMDYIHQIAAKHKLFVLEDCAQAHGAMYKNRKAGCMSDVSAFSFYPTKILGGYGDGGMVVTDNSDIMSRVKRLRFYGMEGAYNAKEHGFNSRLDEVHAAILRLKLEKLNSYITRRRLIGHRYTEALNESSLTLPIVAPNCEHAFYLYVCRHPARDEIISELEKENIIVNVSYRWPIHLMEAYDYLDYKIGDLPNTEKASREIFSLPMYPTLGDDEQKRVIDLLLKLSVC